jgi:uncharacterized protein
MPSVWLNDDSPFHRGEQEAQSRAGMREKMESIGQRVIRDFMIEQHCEFFSQLPFIVIGAVDQNGLPWTSMLAGSVGFLSSPDSRTLRVNAHPIPEDPLANALRPGADVGLLGIDLHTRRRNRLNGRIVDMDSDGFTIQVAQSFGNCPKYIQQRVSSFFEIDGACVAPPRRVMERLDSTAALFIESADTFFISTHYVHDNRSHSHGVDASHRGGMPGFVRIDDDRTLTWPDFIGNSFFNTLGNLMINPRAGLLFPNFETGDLLYVSGRGEVIWESDEIKTFAGAQRLVRLFIDQIIHLTDALPLRWRFEEYSPFLDPSSQV